MEIVKIGHTWPEVIRPSSHDGYIFLHFWEPFELVLKGQTVKTEPHALIIYRTGMDMPRFCGCTDDTALDWFCVSGELGELFEKHELELNRVYYPKNYEFITTFSRKLEAELSSKKEYYREICELYFNEFLILLSREISSARAQSDIDPKTREKLSLLRCRLNLEYNKRWSITDMARVISFSPSYLHAAYKRMFGVSPINDLINIRIRQGKALLRESKLTVNEIAAYLGYSNTSHFIRQFTNREGTSPYKYRQKKRME